MKMVIGIIEADTFAAHTEAELKESDLALPLSELVERIVKPLTAFCLAECKRLIEERQRGAA